MKVTNVAKFERQNPRSQSMSSGGEKGFTLYMRKQKGFAIYLLLIVNEKDPEKSSYVWIKNLASMCSCSSNKKALKDLCRRCQHVFSRAPQLEAHQNDCLGIGEKP